MSHSNSARNHEQARKTCCAGCGQGKVGTQNCVTSALEKLIRKFAHKTYSKEVESFPNGLCNSCKRSLYRCRKAENEGSEIKLRKEWSEFRLDEIKVSRLNADSSLCTCAMCKTAKFSPIGIQGSKEVVSKPYVNVTGEEMTCEIQPRMPREPRGKSDHCPICLQKTGKGVQHSCSRAAVRLSRMGRISRMSQSAERTTLVRRKRSLSELVGKESLQAQENLTRDVITRLVKMKGSHFRLKLAKGGGQSGMGAEVTVGAGKTEHNVFNV